MCEYIHRHVLFSYHLLRCHMNIIINWHIFNMKFFYHDSFHKKQPTLPNWTYHRILISFNSALLTHDDTVGKLWDATRNSIHLNVRFNLELRTLAAAAATILVSRCRSFSFMRSSQWKCFNFLGRIIFYYLLTN